MITAVQTTSLFAYKAIKPELGDRQQVVFDVIKENDGITNLEIAEAIGLPINSVTPRTFELRKMGYVKEWGKRQCKISGRLAIAWCENRDSLF